jgi:hypothetical protein
MLFGSSSRVFLERVAMLLFLVPGSIKQYQFSLTHLSFPHNLSAIQNPAVV